MTAHERERNRLSWLLIAVAVVLSGKVLLPLVLQMVVRLWTNGG